MPTKQQLSDAVQLRRDAERRMDRGDRVTAILFNNLAWQLEEGHTWLELMHDTQLKETTHGH